MRSVSECYGPSGRAPVPPPIFRLTAWQAQARNAPIPYANEIPYQLPRVAPTYYSKLGRKTHQHTTSRHLVIATYTVTASDDYPKARPGLMTPTVTVDSRLRSCTCRYAHNFGCSIEFRDRWAWPVGPCDISSVSPSSTPSLFILLSYHTNLRPWHRPNLYFFSRN